jgi:excisionase family DNA binding protein
MRQCSAIIEQEQRDGGTQSSGTISVAEAAERLNISAWCLYQAIKAGNSPVPIVKVGRRILIPRSPFERLLA